VQLSAEQRRELQNARDHHPKPYVRERSAALLQMAEGKSPHWVATHRVLKPSKPDTLYRWVNWYQTQGLAGSAFPSAGWSGAEASLTAAQNSSSDCVVDPSPLLLASQRPRAGRERESLPR